MEFISQLPLPLQLEDPQVVFTKTVKHLREIFQKTRAVRLVVAVSGGIDSALSLALAVEAVGLDKVSAVMLPYRDQDMTDAQLVISHLGIKSENTVTYQIEPIVVESIKVLGLAVGNSNRDESTQNLVAVRLGNLQARARMLCLYDWAKQHHALVCGTENRSEHFLGYFTRFGDAASDIEPILHLYKTQVRQLAQAVGLPEVILTKSPSAGLWQGQTDEQELGFSYAEADQVLWQAEVLGLLVHLDKTPIPMGVIQLEKAGVSIGSTKITKILERVGAMQFKLEVPYTVASLWQ